MNVILQQGLPYDPFSLPRLPGISPVGNGPWLIRDEAFAAQMALRESLLATRRADVVACLPEARDAAGELLALVLSEVYGAGSADRVTRPDGANIAIDRADPMGTLARLVQEDLCVMQPRGAEHVLTAAALLFPASWTLAEKLGRPLIGIHKPVAAYDAGLAARVQRLFDGIRVGAPLWRFNALWYDDPTLFQPRREDAPRLPPGDGGAYLRSERQVLRRLPETGAVVFSIHTYVVPRAALTP